MRCYRTILPFSNWSRRNLIRIQHRQHLHAVFKLSRTLSGYASCQERLQLTNPA